MNFDTSKTIGGIGAILAFISVCMSVLFSYSGIIGFVGIILMVVGLHGLSGHYREPGIFKYTLIGVVAGVVGIFLGVIVFFTVFLSNVNPLLHQLYPGWDGNLASLATMTPDASQLTPDKIDPATIYPVVTSTVIMLAIMWIFAIIATYFIRRSLKQLSEKSNVGLFGTAGTLLLIGAFLTIIAIGVILIWIAILLLAIAFFQIKHQEPNTPPYDTYQPQTPPQQ
ncbi:MAG: DUF996 domain-containing protein [Nitrososphaerota archaeon]|nr:DUF996 domain-containing protein [Nitrososphaerota archaeon]